MNKICGIYAIQNLQTGKKYIRKSIDIFTRFRNHLKLLRRNEHHSQHLQNSFNKYGENNFVYGIIAQCNVDVLSAEEEHYINKYDSYNNGYNCLMPSGQHTNRVYDIKQKERMSSFMKDYHANPAFEQKRKKAVKKSIETRHRNAALGLIKLGGPEIDVNIRFYNKATLELKHTFKYLREAADFLKVDKKTIGRVIDKITTVSDTHWSYKGYIVLKRDVELDAYLNKKLISTLNYKIRIAKQMKQTKLNLELTKKPKLSKEEFYIKQRRVIQKSVEARRNSGKYYVDVYLRETGEYVNRFPIAADFCREYGLKPAQLSRRWKGNKAYYKGYDIVRAY